MSKQQQQQLVLNAVSAAAATAAAAAASGEQLDLWNELAKYESFVNAFSGMVGGALAISVFYPLNNIRMRLQADDDIKPGNMAYVTKQIIDKYGVEALYQGWWSSVVALGVSNYVYFYTHSALKIVYQVKVLGSRKKHVESGPNLVLGVVAGIVNVLLTTPFWVANTRLTVQNSPGGKGGHGHGAPAPAASGASKSEPYKGVWDCLSRIASEEGVPSLWKGVGSGIILCSNPAIQFAVYERLRRVLEARAKVQARAITAFEFFVIGAIAKAVATVATYPLQRAQTILRNKRDKNSDTSVASIFTTTWKAMADIADKEGFMALFKGMEAKLWQTVLTAAFQFMTYEETNRFITGLLLPGGKAVKGH